MAETAPHILDTETLERIDAAFTMWDYEPTDVDVWLDQDGELVNPEGHRPLLVWEREVITRDIFTDSELTATDLLTMLHDSSDRFIMERWVILDQEDGEGEEELSFAVNMCTGQLLQSEPDPNIVSMVEQFKDRFKLIEEHGEA